MFLTYLLIDVVGVPKKFARTIFLPAVGKLTKGAHFLLELVRIIFVEK
jgi:hypothetical protein